MIRVSYDDLQPSEDHLVLLHEGTPFSGVAVENGNAGKLIAETEYVDGQRSGTSREWYLSGQIAREQQFRLGSLHGTSREWHENGRLKSESLHELGVCVQRKRWNESGDSLEEYRLEDGSPQQRILERLRKGSLSNGQD